MKKVLSLLLAVIIALSIPVSVLAEETSSCNCGTAPVVYIRGFGGGIFKVEDDGSLTNAFAFDGNKIVPLIDDIALALFSLAFGNAKLFSRSAGAILDGIMGDLMCTTDGNSAPNIIPEPSDPTNIDKHKLFTLDNDADTRKDAEYDFSYDWRLDPMIIADDLKDYIEEVKKVTDHDKVVIKCHSEGNCIAAAYLYKHGYDSVEKFCFTAAAFNGINLVGQLFTKDLSLANKGDQIIAFVKSLTEGTESEKTVSTVMDVLDKLGLVNGIANGLHNALIGDVLDTLYDDVLIDAFATWPALWTFVPDSYYENAKIKMFGNQQRYDVLIERIDDYHYNVQNDLASLLKDAHENGVAIVLFSQYNYAPIPVYKGSDSMGDMLVETKYTSFGATTAPYGSRLSLNFNSPDAKYYSKDRLIDASTCLFPDYTWFIRGINHAISPAAYMDFTDWAILYEGQPTVFTDEAHPQFVRLEGDKLVPVTK